MIHKEKQETTTTKKLWKHAETERRNSDVELRVPHTIVLMPWETGRSWISEDTRLRVRTAEQHLVEWATNREKKKQHAASLWRKKWISGLKIHMLTNILTIYIY